MTKNIVRNEPEVIVAKLRAILKGETFHGPASIRDAMIYHMTDSSAGVYLTISEINTGQGPSLRICAELLATVLNELHPEGSAVYEAHPLPNRGTSCYESYGTGPSDPW